MSAQIYLGFDYGWRRLGIAVGEGLTGSAHPVTTLTCRQGRPDWKLLAEIIETWQPAALVVGIPRHADGSASKTTLRAAAFAQELEQRWNLPTHRVDERLSSHEARTRLQEAAGRRLRGASGKALVDRLAAQIILQTWLNEHESVA